jgi:hypothetical protein
MQPTDWAITVPAPTLLLFSHFGDIPVTHPEKLWGYHHPDASPSSPAAEQLVFLRRLQHHIELTWFSECNQTFRILGNKLNFKSPH